MSDIGRVEMLLLLVQNVDAFAWSPYEVLEVDPEFIVHRLNVDPPSQGGRLKSTLRLSSKR